jgi:hypothetical protein
MDTPAQQPTANGADNFEKLFRRPLRDDQLETVLAGVVHRHFKKFGAQNTVDRMLALAQQMKHWK